VKWTVVRQERNPCTTSVSVYLEKKEVAVELISGTFAKRLD